MKPVRSSLAGIAFMIASQLGFLFNDVLVKLAGARLPMGEIIFLRGCFAVSLIAIAAGVLGQYRSIAQLANRAVWGRIIGELGGTFFYLTALFHMPIANVIIIFQATPLTATAAAAIFLREAVGWRRWMAIAIGFFGVVLVVRPGLSGFEPYSVMVLFSVLFVSFRDICTRSMPLQLPTLLLTGATALAVTLMGAAIGVTEDWVAPGGAEVLQLGGAAILIFAGYFCIIAAMRVGEMSVTAPFRYVSVVFAIATGYLIWGDVPDALTILGSAVIIGTGLYSFNQERKLDRRRVLDSATAPAPVHGTSDIR